MKPMRIALSLAIAASSAMAEPIVYTTTAPGGKWSEIAWTPSTPVSGTGAQIVLAGAGDFENDLGAFTLYVVGDPTSLNALAQGSLRQHLADRIVYAARVTDRGRAA